MIRLCVLLTTRLIRPLGPCPFKAEAND